MPFPAFDPLLPGDQPGEAGSALEEPRLAALIGEGHRGKTVLVTGGATGLGRSICLEFGRMGCNVAFCFVGMPGRDVREQALRLQDAGFSVLHLAYHNAPGKPAKLVNVPLEDFYRGLDWLKRQPGIDADRIGIVGYSKGAEAGLLVATRYPGIRAAVLAVDNQQPLINVRSMSSYVDSVLGQRRFTAALMAVFAAIALGLAVIGLYGVIAYTVAQRQREIGVRLALGADPAGIRRLVLRRGVRLAAAGLLVGLLAAVGLSRVIERLLFGVTPFDAATLLSVPLVLGTIALLASWLPARRASRVDPASTIRVE